ncbi:MAG: phospho-N-acetylmuramoyl-pentapeptide-transferase [Lachnospiraceae bacterium]|nr:phospho-N-acetylmuramoyl-pentapeptide-transferase [Lachnospiraceae bacterium]
MIGAFAISLAAGRYLVPLLARLKMGQTEREEGVKAHLAKAGTPTMGGLIFLAAVLVIGLITIPMQPGNIPILWLTFGFGAIGFLDDYLKVVLKRSDGLIAWQKLLLQFAVTTVFALYMTKVAHISLDMLLPFTGDRFIHIGVLAVPLLYFAVIGTVNGTNFTDGLDGLASSVTIVVALFFALVSVLHLHMDDPLSFAMAGALMGFLYYNSYPAKIFMGDTGSLALGGYVAAKAYMCQMPLFILIVGLIYLIEVVSVILQVGYFKKTGGKRLFKMAPIHHHYELCGWSETKIVTCFTILTALLSVLAFSGFAGK